MFNYLKSLFVRNKSGTKTVKGYLETVELHLEYAYIITDSFEVKLLDNFNPTGL